MEKIETLMLDGIERALKSKKWTKRQLSEYTGIPYRSIQNYLSGTTKMPAVVYIKICTALGIDNQYVLQGNFELHHMDLWDALWDALGDGLLDVKLLPLTMHGKDEITLHNRKQQNASKLAEAINIAYDKVRKETLAKPYVAKQKTTNPSLKY